MNRTQPPQTAHRAPAGAARRHAKGTGSPSAKLRTRGTRASLVPTKHRFPARVPPHHSRAEPDPDAVSPRISSMHDDSKLAQKWRIRYDELETLLEQHGRLTGMNRTQNDWLRQQRLAHRENRLLSDREQLLRQLPGALDGDLRSQVSQFVTDTQAWTQQTGKTTAELTARTTVTIDGRRSNIGKKAVYYRRRYFGLETGYGLDDDEISAIEELPGWSWDLPRAGIYAK